MLSFDLQGILNIECKNDVALRKCGCPGSMDVQKFVSLLKRCHGVDNFYTYDFYSGILFRQYSRVYIFFKGIRINVSIISKTALV